MILLCHACCVHVETFVYNFFVLVDVVTNIHLEYYLLCHQAASSPSILLYFFFLYIRASMS